MELTKQELINFTEEIEELWNQGKIRSPIHLSGGNEEQLIELFKESTALLNSCIVVAEKRFNLI